MFAMKSCVYSIVFAWGVAVPAVAQVGFADSRADAIESLLRDKFAGHNCGMAIGLIDEHGRRVFHAGALDNGTNRLVDGDTLFEIGSVTKVFTVLLLQDAVRRGEVEFDDTVESFLSDSVTIPSYRGKKISLLNLATQDSGLPHFPDNLSEQPVGELSRKSIKEFSDAYTIEDMYRFLASYTLSHEPGTKFQYSNVGMALLGHVLERRTSKTYESLVVERICHPLGMKNTRISLSPKQKLRLARGHWLDGEQSEHIDFQAFMSAGSLLSTANDLLKFLSANLGIRQVTLTPWLANMQVNRHQDSPQFGRTAMPWQDNGVYSPPGSELLGHSGGGLGNTAFIGIDIKKRRGVVVLSNQMKVSPSGIGWTLLQEMPLSEQNIAYAVREVTGVGIALGKNEESGRFFVSAVFPKSPAGRAGLEAGVVLQEVDGNRIEGKSLTECLQLLKGPEGKSVRLTLMDPNASQPRVIKLRREKFLTAS